MFLRSKQKKKIVRTFVSTLKAGVIDLIPAFLFAYPDSILLSASLVKYSDTQYPRKNNSMQCQEQGLVIFWVGFFTLNGIKNSKTTLRNALNYCI